MENIKIVSVGTFLPGRKITNADIHKHFSINQDWIDFFIGNKSRYFSIDLDSKKIEYSLSDLCVAAANSALSKKQIQVKDIDFLIMATATPENLMPATVNIVADKLQLNHIPTYELQSGCAGAIQAFDVAYQFIKSGNYRTGLIIGADSCTKYLNLNRDFKNLKSSELINYVLFGDGAGAAVISTDQSYTGMEIQKIFSRFVGLNLQPGQILNWYGDTSLEHCEGQQAVHEDYKAIEVNVPRLTAEVIEEIVQKTNWNKEEIDYFMLPQLGGHMTDKIIESVNIPKHKTINCVAETGNSGNAMPFLQLELLSQKIQPGEKAIAIAIESSKWLKGGMAFYG